MKLLDDAHWDGKLFLGGWENAASVGEVTDKASGEVMAHAGHARAQDVGRAGARARSAQRRWNALDFVARAAIFRAAAALLDVHAHELRRWIMRETGAIAPKADLELAMAKGILHEAAAMLTEPRGLLLPSGEGRISYARRMPHGVVGVIAPFNFPLILATRAVAPALATGNAVILKPDPRTAVSGGILIARVFEEAGLPSGVLTVLPGGAEVGEALCSDENVAMIAFTGSSAVGRRVGELAGRHLKRVSLELGGKNSIVILDDVDPDVAASNAAFGAWMHQGQICMAAGRLLVQEPLAAIIAQKLSDKATHLPIGDPMRGEVALGPVIDGEQVRRIDRIVQESVQAGATLACGGTHEKLFYRPTVLLDVRPGMPAFEQEIFGPVACITPFRTDEEAVELANRTEYGLSASVLSASVTRARRIGEQLNVGILHINDQTVADEPHIPFGGRGASGNGTRIGGPANWEEFTQWQWVTVNDEPPRYPF